MPVTLHTSDADFETRFAAMLAAKREDSTDVNDTVAAIIADVRGRGDAALCELTARFDRMELTPDRLPRHVAVMADGNEYNVVLLKEAGQPVEPVYPAEGTPTISGPTAIFASNDDMAAAAVAAAHRHRLDVPGDLSVVGVDGHPFAEFFGLTTIAQFPNAQGEAAGAAILELVETGAAPGPEPLPFELVARASTAPPR